MRAPFPGYAPGTGPISILGSDAVWHVERVARLDWAHCLATEPDEVRVLGGMLESRLKTLSKCIGHIWACSQKGE